MTTEPKIFCAIDTVSLPHAEKIANAMAAEGQGLKFGMEFINTFGPQGVKGIKEKYPTAPIFIDLKFHDIPNTVKSAVWTVCENLDPAYLNIHALGGRDMMEAAVEGRGSNQSKILAVTILTSMTETKLEDIGLCKINGAGHKETLKDQVLSLANLAQESGLDGVVCSAHEIEVLRKECGKDFILMVPGIRPTYYKLSDDQERTMTPKEALDLGATHLVIGRPLTKSAAIGDIATALKMLLDEIA